MQPTAAPVVCGGTVAAHVVVNSDAALAQLAPAVARACSIQRLTFSGIGNTTLLAEAFQGLQTVAGNLELTDSSTRLATTDGVFPALTRVGGTLQIDDNVNLATLGDGFPALTSVGNQLRINGNSVLTTIGASFGSLQSVGTLNWYGNGGTEGSDGSLSFCASARAVLCPTTASYADRGYASASHDCCNAYCATTMEC